MIRAKNFSDNHFLILAFIAIFLASFGVLSHNVFADTVTTTIPVSGAYGVAANSDTNMAYVANGNTYSIQVINGTTNTVVANVTTATVLSYYHDCHDYTVAVNPKTNLIYTNNNECDYFPPAGGTAWSSQSVSVINGTDNHVINGVTIATAAFPFEPPQPIAVNPATNEIYALVGSPASSSYSYYLAYIDVINGTTNQVTTRISLPDYYDSDIAINTQTNTIYALNGDVIHMINGTTKSIVKNISWGKSAEGLGVNPVTNKIYVSNSDNSVSVIDGSTYQVIANITNTGYGFVGVNPVTNKVYVSSPNGGQIVSVIDGSTNTLAGSVTVGSSPYGMGINSATNKVYVGNSGSSTVSVIDGSSSSGTSSATTAPSAPQNLQTFAGNSQVFLSWATPSSDSGSPVTGYMIQRSTDGGTTWSTIISNTGNTKNGYLDKGLAASTTYTYQVSAINSVGTSPPSNTASATTSTVATIQVGSLPFGIAYDSAKGEIFVTNPGSNNVSVISDDTNTVVATIPENSSNSQGVAYDSAKGEIFVVNKGSKYGCTDGCPSSVSVISDATNTIVDTISGFSSPDGAAYDSAKGEIFVTDSGSSSVSVISDATNTIVATVPVGLSSIAIAYDSAKGEIFVANGNSNISVISDDTNTVVSTISGFSSPDGAAYDSAKGEIFVASGNSNYVYVISDATNTTPGSIALESVQSTSDTTDSSNQITLSNFDATAGNDRLLVVGVSANNNNVGSITFAGVPLTRAVSHFTNNDAEFWYLTNPTGSGDIAVTMNGPTQAVVGAYSFSGVNQTVPIPTHITRHNLTPSSPAISITTSHVNDWVLDMPSIWGGVTLGYPTCTQQWNVNVPSQITGASSSTIVPAPATVTCSWTASSANTWDDVAIELKAATTTTSPTVPDAPTGLVATGGNVQVTLSWAAPSNDGGSAVTGYNVYRGTTAGGEDSTPVASGITSTTYTDTRLTNGQAYYYIVRAVNSVGTSGTSNEASATPASGSSGTSGITLNNVQSTSGTTSSSNQMTLSSFNAGTGSNQLLLVGVSANNNNVTSVTFGGVPLTRSAYSFYNNDAEFWYLANPTGSGDIIVTMNGPTQAVVGAYAFSGVNQTLPIPTHVVKHNVNPNSPNISLTTKYANDWVLDLPSIYGGSTLSSPTCTQQWNVNVPDAITGASSSTMVQSPGAVTCGWTASSADLWDDAAVEINAASR